MTTDFHDYSDPSPHCTCLEYVVEDLQRVIKNLIPLAESYCRHSFDFICDHEDDCSCDQRSKALAIIEEANESIS